MSIDQAHRPGSRGRRRPLTRVCERRATVIAEQPTEAALQFTRPHHEVAEFLSRASNRALFGLLLAAARQLDVARDAARAEANPAATPAPSKSPAPPGALTRREVEIVTLVATGLSNREIAERLVIGERTVDTHVTNIKSKLDLHRRVQITAWAIAHNLTSPESARA
jgi:DNA-binding NarL/FixJ family response regulator